VKTGEVRADATGNGGDQPRRGDQQDVMTVMQELPAGPERTLDADAASTFLHSQARWLAHALDKANVPEIVGTVLGLHDASHEAWLELIADVERLDERSAQDLAALYSYHGRVVGSLERGLDPLLNGSVQVQVRQLLADRLEAMTSAAAQLVEDLAARPAHSG
jgi:hypothetical protein